MERSGDPTALRVPDDKDVRDAKDLYRILDSRSCALITSEELAATPLSV